MTDPKQLALNAAILRLFPAHIGPLSKSDRVRHVRLTGFDIWAWGLEKLIDYVKAVAGAEAKVIVDQGRALRPMVDRMEAFEISFVVEGE